MILSGKVLVQKSYKVKKTPLRRIIMYPIKNYVPDSKYRYLNILTLFKKNYI